MLTNFDFDEFVNQLKTQQTFPDGQSCLLLGGAFGVSLLLKCLASTIDRYEKNGKDSKPLQILVKPLEKVTSKYMEQIELEREHYELIKDANASGEFDVIQKANAASNDVAYATVEFAFDTLPYASIICRWCDKSVSAQAYTALRLLDCSVTASLYTINANEEKIIEKPDRNRCNKYKRLQAKTHAKYLALLRGYKK